MKVGIIILNYNKPKKTLECVYSILHQNIRHDVSIYLVDNHSTDNSLEIFCANFKVDINGIKIKIIKAEENYGYAKGNNLGIKIAEEDLCDTVIISNNDIIFEEKSINKLLDYYEKNDYRVIIPKILDTNGNIQDSFALNRKNKLKHIIYGFIPQQKSNKKVESKIREVFYFSGCCFLVSMPLFKKIGYFDEHTFLYYEEHIISEKLFRLGEKILYYPFCAVVHNHDYFLGEEVEWNIRIQTAKSEMYYLKEYLNASKVYIRLFYILKSIKYLLITFFKGSDLLYVIKYYKFTYHSITNLFKDGKDT